MNKFSRTILIYITIAGIFALSYLSGFIGKDVDSGVARILLSSSTFLFGVFIAFSISNAHRRIDAIFNSLNQHNAILLYIYKSARVFDTKTQKKVQQHIDSYLISTIDYYITDLKFTFSEFENLFEYLDSIEPKNKKQERVWDQYNRKYAQLTETRKHIEVLARAGLLKLEWLVVFSLLGVIVFFILSLSSGSLSATIASTILITAIVVLVYLLHNLNSLSWKERHKIWRPLHQLFRELDLEPYYPAPVVEQKRAIPKSGDMIRLAYYHGQYPDVKDKTVKKIKAS